METYTALLRGINVGGKNRIPMADLRAAVEDLGYTGVRTYIQSGNVVFAASGGVTRVKAELEAMMPRRFSLDSATIMVLVLDIGRMTSIVETAPAGFGAEPDTYKYDVAFLDGFTGDDVLSHLAPHPEVDAVWASDDALYYRRLTSRLTSSRMSRIAGTPAYASMTIRNWNTTTRLLAMMDGLRSGSGS